MDPTIQTKTSANASSPLQTKYYCKLDKATLNMNVVMELIPTMTERIERLPLRYVLLIDVSQSMDEPIRGQQKTLLQRVQTFAELAVRKVDENDWISIVTFSDDVKIVLPMQRMTKFNKRNARQAINRLHTEAGTNFEIGMYGAIEAFRTAPTTHRACRDCIILFTDGLANRGETDSKKLINSYLQWQNQPNRKSSIPLSAFTIGGYQPELLIELSRHLGSESFYWLNDEQDFEADMLIPVFLREVTNISDVDIRLVTSASCYFDPVNFQAAHFKGTDITKLKAKIKKKKIKLKVPTTEKFFIHALPDATSKNLSFNVQLLEIEGLNNEKVVDVHIRYLDCELYSRTIHDCIVLNTNSSPASVNQRNMIYGQFLQVSAFIIWDNYLGTSQTDIEEVLIRITREKYRLASINCIGKAMAIPQDHRDHLRKVVEEAYREINEIRGDVISLLPEHGESSIRIDQLHEEWSAIISDVDDLVAKNDNRNYCKLAAMETSIATGSPTGEGIFRGNQPFMSEVVRNKLNEEKQNLKVISRLGRSANVESVKISTKRAIENGDVSKIESCLQDLKALELLGEEITDDYIHYVGMELRHRMMLEDVKNELEVAIRSQDFPVVSSKVSKLKELSLITNLTFTASDKEAFERGTKVTETNRLKHSLRGEIAKHMPILKLPMIPENMSAIALSIESLTYLKNQAKVFDNVFTDRDNGILNVAIVKHRQAVSEIDSLRTKMEELSTILLYPRRPANYEAIKNAITEMEEIQTLAEEKYLGLFTSTEKNALMNGIESRDILTAELEKAQEKLAEFLPIFELPMIPRNYAELKATVEAAQVLKRNVIGFKGIFSEENDKLLDQASAKVLMLMTTRDDLIEKLNNSIPNASLPKLPGNLDKIKAAVEVLSIVKHEANGFDDVYTTEHDEISHRAIAAMKILEAEKEEIMREESECIPQIQLPMLPKNFSSIQKGVDAMKRITPDLKEFGLYKDEYDGFMNQAVFNRDVLDEKRQQILLEIQKLKPDLKVSLVPENLPALRLAVDKMATLKNNANGFENVFTNANETDLYQAQSDLAQLTKSIDQTEDARHRLEEAMEKRNFSRLKYAFRKASKAPFISNDELLKAKKELEFLSPDNRCAAVENAVEEEDLDLIEEELLNLREAKVINDALEEKASKAMKQIRKKIRQEKREERRRAREEARRRKALERIEKCLIHAIETNEVENLEEALYALEFSEFKDDEVPHAGEARDLLQHLKIERLRERLNKGCQTRDVETLYNALMDVKHGNYQEHMEKEYAEAESILVHVLEMMRLREEIQKMSRAGISEVHSYSKPPVQIKKIMRALFIILGEKPKELNWFKVQNLMSKLDRYSMTKRVKRFRMKDLDPQAAEQARKCISDIDLDDVEKVSKVAATLFAWVKYVVKEEEHLRETKEKESLEDTEISEKHQYDEEDFESDENDESSPDAGNPEQNEIVEEENNSTHSIPENESDPDNDIS